LQFPQPAQPTICQLWHRRPLGGIRRCSSLTQDQRNRKIVSSPATGSWPETGSRRSDCKRHLAGPHFPEVDFRTVIGKADSPIHSCRLERFGFAGVGPKVRRRRSGTHITHLNFVGFTSKRLRMCVRGGLILSLPLRLSRRSVCPPRRVLGRNPTHLPPLPRTPAIRNNHKQSCFSNGSVRERMRPDEYAAPLNQRRAGVVRYATWGYVT
jgi:hypothetical protein